MPTSSTDTQQCCECKRWIPADEIWWVLPPELDSILKPKPYCPKCEEFVEHL